MAGTMRLFEKDGEGFLHEVPSAEADARRQAGIVSRVALQVDVLWTAEELAQRAQEEVAALAAKEQQAEARRLADAAARQMREQAEAKLAALGLTSEEIAALRS